MLALVGPPLYTSTNPRMVRLIEKWLIVAQERVDTNNVMMVV